MPLNLMNCQIVIVIKNQLERKIYIILTLLWVVSITILSLVSFDKNTIITVQNTDKIVHFTFYFILTLLLFRCVKKTMKFKYLIIISLSIFYGIIIEVLQMSFTTTRKGDLYDVLANSIGVFCAAMLNKMLIESISTSKI